MASQRLVGNHLVPPGYLDEHITNAGVFTSFLPVTSAWPSISQCNSAIYSQIDGPDGGALAIAFNPFFGISINTKLTCLPPAATLWWDQATATPLLTHISLGPLVCPGGYSTPSTSAVDSQTTFIACCPTSYSYVQSKDAATLGECNSPLTVGQVLTYVDLTSGPRTTTKTIAGAGASVYAVHVDGYVFAASPTSSSTSSGNSASSTTGSGTSSTPTASSTASSSGLSSGAKAGIGIGVTIGILGLGGLILACCLVKRHRAKRGPTATELSGYSDSPHNGSPRYMNEVHVQQPAPLHELPIPEQKKVYEMSGTNLK